MKEKGRKPEGGTKKINELGDKALRFFFFSWLFMALLFTDFLKSFCMKT